MSRLRARIKGHSGFVAPLCWPINPIMHKLLGLFAVVQLASAAWISEGETSTTAERTMQEVCGELAGGGLQCRKILLQQETSNLQLLRRSDLEEKLPSSANKRNVISHRPHVLAPNLNQQNRLSHGVQANNTNPPANASKLPSNGAIDTTNLAHHGTDTGASLRVMSDKFTFPIMFMRTLHHTSRASVLQASIVVLVATVLLCTVAVCSSVLASHSYAEGEIATPAQQMRNLSFHPGGVHKPPQQPACNPPPSPIPMQSPLPSTRTLFTTSHGNMMTMPQSLPPTTEGPLSPNPPKAISPISSNTLSMSTLFTASPGKMMAMPQSLQPTPVGPLSPNRPKTISPMSSSAPSKSVLPSPPKGSLISRHLCPGLVVPENSECCLAVPTMRSVGLAQKQSEAFDVLDLCGKPVIRVEVNAPSMHEGPASTAIDTRPFLIIRAAVAKQLLAYCKTDKETKGQRSVYLYNAQDELFAHLAKDPFRNSYNLTGGTPGLRLTFDGNFQEHVVTITNEHREVQADASPVGQAFSGQLPPGHYQFRIVSCVDMGLMLCGILSIDHMETEWSRSAGEENEKAL